MNSIELEDIATDFLICFMDQHKSKFMNNAGELPIMFELNRNGIKELVSQTFDSIEDSSE